ncbi:MAG: hypothetical protein JXA30_16085 [Deltaproteobacteria bacterium]|nr:hypothetical protein [Deltaproteobacteria bacterium]
MIVKLSIPAFLLVAFVFFARCSSDDKQDNHKANASDAIGEAEAKQDSGNDESDSAVPDPAYEADASAGSVEIPAIESSADCQLSGKWISLQRTMSIALGGAMKQAGHNWAYWEFEQSGTEVVVKKGLKCGVIIIERSESTFSEVIAGPALWNGLTNNIFNTGRRAVYGESASDQCFLHLERYYLVRGATVSYFSDPDASLGKAETEKKGTTPGWEDWDEDGNPGVTFRLAGIANGEIYVAQREWTEYFGPTEKSAERFRLQVLWNHEQLVIKQVPASLPPAESWPSTEPDENFVIFVRVDNLKKSDGSDLWDLGEEADDLTVCERMRQLKDELFDDAIVREDLEMQASR